ncbi:MAG: sulfite exporter TauE/SafE family protein, partial [Bacteroidota bacterium]
DPGRLLQRWAAYQSWQFRLRGSMAGLLQRGGAGRQFSLGMCNGLLPCGLVYLAIVGAANTGNPLAGATFMVVFGTGTLPLLLLTLLAGKRLLRVNPGLLSRLTPYVMAAVGLLLLWRGYTSHVPADFYEFQDMAFPPMCH